MFRSSTLPAERLHWLRGRCPEEEHGLPLKELHHGLIPDPRYSSHPMNASTICAQVQLISEGDVVSELHILIEGEVDIVPPGGDAGRRCGELAVWKVQKCRAFHAQAAMN